MKQLLVKESNYSNSRKSIYILLILMGIVCLTSWKAQEAWANYTISKAEPQLKKEQTISSLQGQVIENRQKVEAIDKIKNAKQISETELKSAIAVLFSKNQDRALKVQNCENGKRIADRFHTNKDGTKDYGIWQINNFWHSKRVERLFNVPFIKAVVDPAKNTIYAAILHNQQGNLSAWSCDGKIG